MKAIKRLVCLLCLVMLCLSLFPLSNTASAIKYTESIQWHYNDGLLTITGTGDFFAEKPTLPWDKYRSEITEIIIGPGITELGGGLFQDYTRLTRVTLPDGLTGIGRACFSGCSRLTDIQLPNSLKWIDREAFKGCSSITSINIPNSMRNIYSGAFSNCDALKTVHISSIATWLSITFEDNTATPLYYGARLLLDGKPLTDITVPDGVDEVPQFAFYGCKDLRTVVLPEGITRIGGRAFSGCRNLTHISLPTSLESVGNFAFEDCHSLTEITYSGGINKIKKMTIAEGNDVVLQHLSRIYSGRIMIVRKYINCGLGLLVVAACVFFTRKRRSF